MIPTQPPSFHGLNDYGIYDDLDHGNSTTAGLLIIDDDLNPGLRGSISGPPITTTMRSNTQFLTNTLSAPLSYNRDSSNRRVLDPTQSYCPQLPSISFYPSNEVQLHHRPIVTSSSSTTTTYSSLEERNQEF